LDLLQLTGLVGGSPGEAVSLNAIYKNRRMFIASQSIALPLHLCSMDPSALVIQTVEGSPISRQPVHTLALVCRFLTALDLIATHPSNKLLSSAASHPLTFQNGCQTGLIDQLRQVTTYARGPGAEFNFAKRMQQAFSGKLFRHFHILRLKIPAESLGPMLKCLAMDRAPTLRSLTLHCTSGESDFCVTEEVRHALRFMTRLHVHGRQQDIVLLLDLVVPSVELLQITFIHPAPAKVYADILLRPGCSVRQVVYAMQPGVSRGTDASALVDLARLESEPRIEKICWAVPIRLDRINFSSKDLKDLTWNLHSNHVGVLRTRSLPALARFPQLTRLEMSGSSRSWSE
jgi:hypothetical protein